MTEDSLPAWLLQILRDAGLSSSEHPLAVLPAHPAALETELFSGKWVVLSSAVWSQPDLMTVEVAARLCARLQGQVLMAVRLYSDVGEHQTWCRGIDVDRDIYGSPIWLFMKNGIVDRFYVGPHLGKEGEERMYRRIVGWLNGEKKELPPSDFSRLAHWIISFWQPAKRGEE